MFSISGSSAGHRHVQDFLFIFEDLPHYAGEIAGFQWGVEEPPLREGIDSDTSAQSRGVMLVLRGPGKNPFPILPGSLGCIAPVEAAFDYL